jgi:pimeloyl-ACP methyl ester carboxylesterase
MRLAVHTSGDGPRTAVLIHGMMSDHRAWHRVARELEDAGYRVVAVDLAGHGASPRSRRYSPRNWADDVIESLEPVLDGAPDLLMGHSLGALVASLVAEHFGTRAAVYVDPAFAFPRGVRGVALKTMFTLAPRPGAWTLRRLNPGWSAADVALELQTLRVWDKRTIFGFINTRPLRSPRKLVAPSLVILAERSLLIGSHDAERMRRDGMTVEVMRGAGHTVFRDDHGRFMRLVTDWLARQTHALHSETG